MLCHMHSILISPNRLGRMVAIMALTCGTLFQGTTGQVRISMVAIKCSMQPQATLRLFHRDMAASILHKHIFPSTRARMRLSK
jgi:hypothetical protein